MLGLDLDTLLAEGRGALGRLSQAIFEEPDAFIAFLRRCDDADEPATRLVRQLLPVERDLAVYVAPVRLADGTRVGSLRVLRDVTQERRVDRLKTEVISIVSHELRTPLTSIKGFADLLLDDAVAPMAPEQQRKVVEGIAANADRLSGLVTSVLDLARIEEGRVRNEPEALQAADIVLAAVQLMEAQFLVKKQTVLTNVPADLPLMWGDRRIVFDVLQNLLSNATKYTPEHGTIQVTAASEWRTIRIAVHDDGIGMSAADQDRLFTRFFRSQNAATRGIPGVGLGLVITQSLVELLGGDIQVVSALGEGSTFSFSVPLLEQPETDLPVVVPLEGQAERPA
jgi:signal transduction histidine kinase